MRNYFLIALFAILPCFAYGQGTTVPQSIVVTNSLGRPLGGVKVEICTTASASSPACAGAASIYSDSALTVPVACSSSACLTSDSLGQVPTFFALPGTYCYTVSGAYITDTSCHLIVLYAATGGTGVITNPSGTQNIVQPAGSNLNVNRFEGLRFSDQFTGSTWDVRVAACIAALPATGPGTCDASNDNTGLVSAGSLSISRADTVLKVGNYTLTQAANQISVVAGTNNVRIVAPEFEGYAGGSASFTINYTGSGAAIVVGGSGSDTSGFQMFGGTVNLTSANSAAIGIQLNRAINYTLDHPTVYGLLTANTQKLIDLEGTGNFTGGTMIQPYLTNGCYGIYFGSNANDNSIFNPQIPGISGCYGEYFAGGASFAGGNSSYGGDIENVSYAYYFDKAEFNRIYGARTEGIVTDDAFFSVNSLQNAADFADGVIAVSDSAGNNSATSPYYINNIPQLGNFGWRTKADVTASWIFQSGSASDQSFTLNWADKAGANKWTLGKASTNSFNLQDGSGNIRFQFAPTSTSIEGPISSSNPIAFNDTTNASTGGVVFYGGGGSPAQVATISGAGKGTFVGVTASGTSLIQTATTVVGSLPSAASNTGAMIRVSDSTAVAAEGQTCVGGNSNVALAFSNGSVWKCF